MTKIIQILEIRPKEDYVSFQSHIRALIAPSASPGTISSSSRRFLYLTDYLLLIKAEPPGSYLLTCKLRLLSSADANDLGLVQKITTRLAFLCSGGVGI